MTRIRIKSGNEGLQLDGRQDAGSLKDGFQTIAGAIPATIHHLQNTMNPTDHQIIETMEQRGGHFVRCLAALWLAGDPGRRGYVEQAFRETFRDYRNLTIREMEVAARESAAS